MLCRHWRGLSFVLSVMYMMLYNTPNLTLNSPSYGEFLIYMKKVALFNKHLQILFKKGTAPDSTILIPVYRLNMNKQALDQ